jgi:cyanophycinase
MKVIKKNSCPVPNGSLLIIGGAENKGESDPEEKKAPSDFQPMEILKAFVNLTGKKDPIIEVVTSASTKGAESFSDYSKAFKKLNISNIGHIHHAQRTDVLDDQATIDRIKKADAIFFAGGDQLKYTFLYGGTQFLIILKERYINDKLVIAGTSAGAMAMSTPMIYAGNDEVQELGGMIKVTTGLEFLRDVCIDTHFVHRGRFVRMAQVVVTNPASIGLGIEEDTAVIVRNGCEVEVVGSGTMIVMEGHHITEASISDFASEKAITIRDLKVHILSGNQKYIIPITNPPHM